MAMTVKNFLELPITKDFTVLAGKNDLHQAMKNVEILDFEFLEGFENTRETMFTEKSLVLTSLLFAKDRPDLLVHMIHELVRFKVSGLAFKAVIFDTLPQNVIDLAEENRLPLLKFGGDEFFEDIIFQTMDYRNKSIQTEFIQTTVANLIEANHTAEQLSLQLKQLNKPFDDYCYVTCIKGFTVQAEELFTFEPLVRTGLISSFKGYIVIVMTNNDANFDFQGRMTELIRIFDLNEEVIYRGNSRINRTNTALHKALQQAYYAMLFATMYDRKSCDYERLKTEQLLIQLIRTQKEEVGHYVANYIEPLEAGDNQLLATAIDYVLLEGNIKAVADKQFCHQNTIRYRLSKMRGLSQASQSEFAYYEELSIAVKLYLLQQNI